MSTDEKLMTGTGDGTPVERARGRETVVVAEGEPGKRSILRQTLESGGFEVIEAPDTSTATQLVSRLGNSLLLLGPSVREDQGLKVCQECRDQKDRCLVPIVHLLPSTLAGVAAEPCGLGADVHLMEPADPRLLLSTLSGLMRNYRTQAELAAALGREQRLRNELQKARDELERTVFETQQQLSDLLRQAPVPIMLYAEDGEVLHVSHVWTTVTGYSLAAAPTLAAWAHSAYRDKADQMLALARQLIETGGALLTPIEVQVWTPSGECRTLLFTSSPVGRLVDGRRIRMTAAVDITERRQAEQKLRASETRFRLALAHSPITVWEQDRDLRYTWVYNPRTGLSPTDLVGHTNIDVLEADSAARLTEIQRRVLETGQTVHAEMSITVGGVTTIHDLHMEPLYDEAGNTAGVTGAATDITERKRTESALRDSESRFRSLFSTMSEGFAVHELICDERGEPSDYRFLDVNPAFERLTGLRSADVVGRTVRQVLPGIDPIWIERYGRVTLTGVPEHFEAFSSELQRWYEVSASRTEPGRFAVVFLDVTERKRAEEALRRAESLVQQRNELLETVMGNIPVMITWYDTDGRMKFINRACEKMIGISAGELPEIDLMAECFPDPEYRRYVWEYMLKASAEWRDIRIRSRMGSEVETAWVNVRLSDGSQIGIGIDASKRKEAEEALRRTILDHVVQGVILLDGAGNVLWLNPAALRMLGIPRPEEAPGHLEGFGNDLQTFDSEGRPFAAADWPATRALKGVAATDVEMEVVRQGTGMRRLIAINAVPIRDSDGQVMNVVITTDDITDRKKAEEALKTASVYNRSLIDASLDPLVTIGPDGKITDVNAATEQVTGRCRSELIGTDFSDYFTEPHKARAGYEQVFRDGHVRDYSLSVRHRNGEVTPVRYNATLYRDRTGQAVGVFAAARDVTALLRAEAEIRSLNAELEQRVVERTAQLEAANRELETFAYSVAHDLRAPLRAVSGFSGALFEDCHQVLTEQGRQHLNRIQNGCRRMGRLIDDLLQLSRVTRAQFRRQRVNLSEIAWSIVRDLEKNAPHRVAEFDISSGMMADGDEALLWQVLENLLGNAWKFTGKRAAARIEFSSAGQDEFGKRVFVVRDNGAGFDMKYADKLFGAFQRLHPAAEFPGSGIGLATVQRIVQRHGGRIWAEAAVDQGAAFYFSL